jgi:hypothetical protein
MSIMSMKVIALPLNSLLLHGVSARPYFGVWARRRKHARRHARPRDGLKASLALTPRNNRLSNGRAMIKVKCTIFSTLLHVVSLFKRKVHESYLERQTYVV